MARNDTETDPLAGGLGRRGQRASKARVVRGRTGSCDGASSSANPPYPSGGAPPDPGTPRTKGKPKMNNIYILVYLR